MSLTLRLQVAARAVVRSGASVYEEIESKVDVLFNYKEAEGCSNESINAVSELGGERNFVATKSEHLVHFFD